MISDNKVLNNMFLNRIKRVAIKATPKDTGNLAYNALVVHPNSKGFSVRYKSSVAGYGVFLNDFRKLRGFAQGKLNPHYLWFDNGVHNNIINEIIRTMAKGKPAKSDKIIHPTARTFEETSLRRNLNQVNSSQMTKNIINEQKQYETFKDWNSRFDQFKNNNEKGWGI
jgi:hypothetical protein